MKQKSYHEEKRNYLGKKILDGARALYDFFEVLKEKKTNPHELADELSDKYQLTNNQKDYLKKIAKRTRIAQNIVKSLESKFDIEEGVFKEPKKLHRRIVQGPYKNVEKAISYNLAIEFEKSNWDFKQSLAHLNSSMKYSFNPEILKIYLDFNELSTQNPIENKYLGSLSFSSPSEKELLKESKSKKIPRKLMKETLTNQMLRIVFENIINPENASIPKKEFEGFSGFIYSLYSNNNLSLKDFKNYGMQVGFKSDLKKIKERMDVRENRLKRLKEIRAPKVILDNEEKMFNEAKNKFEDTRKEFKKILPFIIYRDINPEEFPILSYIVSGCYNPKNKSSRIGKMKVANRLELALENR